MADLFLRTRSFSPIRERCSVCMRNLQNRSFAHSWPANRSHHAVRKADTLQSAAMAFLSVSGSYLTAKSRTTSRRAFAFDSTVTNSKCAPLFAKRIFIIQSINVDPVCIFQMTVIFPYRYSPPSAGAIPYKMISHLSQPGSFLPA